MTETSAPERVTLTLWKGWWEHFVPRPLEQLPTAEYLRADRAREIIAGERGWQPIETAPKDEFVLACWGGPLALYAVGWNDALERWEDMTGEAHQPPTHWMPLPEPPAAFVRQGGPHGG